MQVIEECTIIWSYIILIAAGLADGVIYYVESGFSHGIFSKTVFLVLFVIQLVRTVKVIHAEYDAARQADKLRAELAESRKCT